jgi:methyl-accepting chemotaxis protein
VRLRPRLTIFTISLVVLVVACASLSTILSFRYLLREEMKTTQQTHFQNFLGACRDVLYLGDDLAIQAYSESLEKTVPALAYAVFVDHSRVGIQIGGVESLQRFRRNPVECGETEEMRQKGLPFVKDVHFENEWYRYYCQQVSLTNVRGVQAVGTVFLGFNMDILETGLAKIIDRMWFVLLCLMAVVLTFGLILAYILASKITKPIRHLTEGAKAIGEGYLDTQIPIESTDELGFLAQEFNYMAIKLRELDQLKDDFVSSVSHELRSPLSAISGYVELLRSKPLDEIAPEKREKALGIIQESTSRLTHFINDILDLAKLKSGHVDLRQQPFDANASTEDLF